MELNALFMTLPGVAKNGPRALLSFLLQRNGQTPEVCALEIRALKMIKPHAFGGDSALGRAQVLYVISGGGAPEEHKRLGER